MSEFRDIKTLWKSADSQIMANESLDSETVRQSIAKQSIGITSKLLKNIRAGILALIIGATLFSYNIYGYEGNNLISIISITGLIISALLLSFLFYQYSSFNKIDTYGLSLQDLILAKIRYFKKSLGFVHNTIATSLVLLTISLNLFADNNEGDFQVNNIWLFIGLIIITYFLSVSMLHLSHSIYLKQFRTALEDLNKPRLTELDAEFRKHKWIRVLFLTIIMLGVIAGAIVLFLKISGN